MTNITGPMLVEEIEVRGKPTVNAEFHAGVGIRNITPPPQLVNNSLHCAMTVRFDEQGSPLYAKALMLSFGGQPRMLVSLDLVFLLDPVARVLRETVAAATGLAVKDIVVSCSHSHSTPMIEPLDRPHPFLDFVTRQTVDAAVEAMHSQRPARIGHGLTHAPGASFNTQVLLPDGRVKFVRDYREGLASGQPVDSRLSVVRIDDKQGRPIAGWVRFAAHPANVIFDAPVSAEYPGYMAERLRERIDGLPPILFGYGASGDVNCIPMFGRECESRDLGHRLGDLATENVSVYSHPISTTASDPQHHDRVAPGRTAFDPDARSRDRRSGSLHVCSLDRDPRLVWVLGFNCGDHWPIEKKKSSARPLADWARRVKEFSWRGTAFPGRGLDGSPHG